ncbi:MAG TPA: hypothetical protein VFX61_08715 [Micromonosporaceae bacterium]|nr:hypothetical protein [Micromonosporaceae bacterium]
MSEWDERVDEVAVNPADSSGHPGVDAIMQSIANAANLPLAEQIAQYEAAHRTLREILATIDQT